MAFDHGKTEAVIFWKKRKSSEVKVRVGDNEVPFNKEATRWLVVWLDLLDISIAQRGPPRPA